MINVVSNDEPPAVGEMEQERLAREARNIDRFNRRQIEAEAEEEARCIRVQPRDLNNAFDRVGDKQVFRTPSANVAVAMATMQRLPNTPEIQAVRNDIQAYLTAAMAWTAEIVNQAQAPSVSVESSHSRQYSSRSQPPNQRGSRNNDPSDNCQGGNGGHDGGRDDNRRNYRDDNR